MEDMLTVKLPVVTLCHQDVAARGNETGKRSLTLFSDRTAHVYMVVQNVCQHQSFPLDLMLRRKLPVQKTML